MAKHSFMIRQGDVLVMGTDRKPEGQRIEPDAGRVVLAHGEATGHHHSIAAGPTVAMFRPDDMPAGSGGFLLRVEGEAVELRHQEHDAIAIPPGDFEVRRQREYSPQAIRRVED